MRAGRFSFFSPLALTALFALIVMLAWEWLDRLVLPEMSPWQHQVHNILFVSIASCIAGVFILRNLKTRSFMASIVESTEDGIIAKDLDGRIISWNMGAQQIYGYSFEEVKGKPTSMLVARDVVDETPKILDRIREGKRVEHIEAHHVRKDGKPIHVSLTISPIKNATGTIAGASTIVRDITERKRIEAALQESEERMRFALESAQIGTFDYKPATGEVFWNEQSKRFRGLLPGEQLNYAGAIERIHPEDRERVERDVKSALEPDAGGLFESEYRIVWPDNSIHWVVSRGRVQFEGSGVQRYAVRMAGISLDTTERKQAEEALRISEDRRHLAQDAANAGTWEWDLRTNENFWSEELWRLYGLEPYSCKPSYEAWRETLHPDDRDRTEQVVREAARNGAELNAEWRVSDHNGTHRWLMSRGHPVLDADGRVERYIGIVLDITERKRMEEELQRAKATLEKEVKRQTADLVLANERLTKEIQERRRSEETLRQSEIKYKKLSQEFDVLLNAISDTLVLLSPEMKVLWTNNGTAYHVDVSLAELTGQCCYNLFYGRSAPCEDCPVVRCFQTGEAEAQVSGRSGRFLDKRAYPIKDGDQVSSVILLVSDITEKMSLQAEAMQANHLASLGELAAGVAHEINNPINGIINYAQILVNECGPDSLENDMGQRIVKEGDRIADIVRSLLSFARGGREDKRPARVDAILKESLILTQAQIRKEGIRLETYLAEDLPEIEASFQQIQQVFLNLISNARYAIHEKYPARHEDKTIEIRGESVTLNGRDHARITFYDRGAGIPADKMSLLTKPFFSTKPFGKGTGLGLAITHRIVTDHGGQIGFESVEGEFTRVTIDLPVKGFSSG